MKRLAGFLLTLGICASLKAQITVDGNMSEVSGGYYRILGVANSRNGFGSGDDLGALYYYSDATTLFIGITCRLTSNNNVVLFFDSRNYDGRGNQTLAGTSGSVSVDGVFRTQGLGGVACNGIPGNGGLDGATMDFDCFDADFAFAFNEGNTIANFFLDVMRFSESINATGYLAGGNVAGSSDQTGTPHTSGVPFGAGSTISGNITYAYRDNYDPVLNPLVGIEFSIPYAAMPGVSRGDPVRFFVLLTNGDGFASNECIPGDLGPDPPLPGCDFDFSSVVGQNFCTFPDVILPIDFIDVKLTNQNKLPLLQWSVAQDYEATHYTVERSANGISFAPIATLPAKRLRDIATYSYTDESPLPGKSFYRIRAVGAGGLNKVSVVVSLQNDNAQDNTIFIFPNPVKDQLNIKLANVKPGTYRLEIINTTGQLIYKSSLVHDGSSRIYPVKLPIKPASGMYWLKLSGDQPGLQQKILIN